MNFQLTAFSDQVLSIAEVQLFLYITNTVIVVQPAAYNFLIDTAITVQHGVNRFILYRFIILCIQHHAGINQQHTQCRTRYCFHIFLHMNTLLISDWLLASPWLFSLSAYGI